MRDSSDIIQCVVSDKKLVKEADELLIESSLELEGNLHKDKRAPNGYELNISKENLKKLEDNLPNLEARRLEDDYALGVDERMGDGSRIYVPAEFIFDNKIYEVEVRYRGNQ